MLYLNKYVSIFSGAVNKPRTILPKESHVPSNDVRFNTSQGSTSADLSVDSFINKLMRQDVPEHFESIILPKPLLGGKTMASDIHTEEIDSGIAPAHVKEVNNLTEAMAHLESSKRDKGEQSDDLFKSSEDEDPFKFLSPSHIPNFPSEAWLNEEVCQIKPFLQFFF